MRSGRFLGILAAGLIILGVAAVLWALGLPSVAISVFISLGESITLAGLRILEQQSAEIDQALASARRSGDLAQKLYDAGRSGYLELLDAQRNLATVERTAVQLRGDRAVTTVALIRALGGGWETGRAAGTTDANVAAR